jgi:hypothetical protein
LLGHGLRSGLYSPPKPLSDIARHLLPGRRAFFNFLALKTEPLLRSRILLTETNCGASPLSPRVAIKQRPAPPGGSFFDIFAISIHQLINIRCCCRVSARTTTFRNQPASHVGGFRFDTISAVQGISRQRPRFHRRVFSKVVKNRRWPRLMQSGRAVGRGSR